MSKLAANDVEHSNFRQRLEDHQRTLDEHNKIYLALEKQSGAIQSMNTSLGRVEKKVDGISTRVDALEKEPGEKWKKVTWEIVKYVVLALVGLAVGWILKTP